MPDKDLKDTMSEFLSNFHQEVMYYYMTEEGLNLKGNINKYSDMICNEFDERRSKKDENSKAAS